MGGTLWQDLPSQRPSEIKHSQGKPYGAATHSVEPVSYTHLDVYTRQVYPGHGAEL